DQELYLKQLSLGLLKLLLDVNVSIDLRLWIFGDMKDVNIMKKPLDLGYVRVHGYTLNSFLM
ncbi:MAG: hypothetical protein ACK53L_24035, partial [Pirellulaceae bacterium]